MKKLSAILLLFVYLASQFGAVSWHICKPLAHVYFSWIQQHNKEDLIIINIDQQEYNELKNEEDEIIIAGILYDVEEAKLNGTTIELSLKKDSKETKWDNHYNTFSKLLHKHSTGRKQATAGKMFNIFLPLFHSKGSGLTFPPEKDLAEKHCNVPTSYHPSPLIGLITPPPKTC